MRTVMTVMTTVGVVAAIVVIFAGRATRAEGPGAQPLYGVVSLAQIMREFKEVQEIRDKLQKRAEDFQKEGEARRQKIEETRLNRDMEHPDSPKWFEHQKELNRLTVELELWSKFEQKDLEAEKRQQLNVLYKRILGAVEQVAKHRGLDLVFRYDTVDLNDPNALLTTEAMRLRAVVYGAPRVDVTKDVIHRVNNPSGRKGK